MRWVHPQCLGLALLVTCSVIGSLLLESDVRASFRSVVEIDFDLIEPEVARDNVRGEQQFPLFREAPGMQIDERALESLRKKTEAIMKRLLEGPQTAKSHAKADEQILEALKQFERDLSRAPAK